MERFTIDATGKATPEIIQGLADLMHEVNSKIAEAEHYAKTHGLEFSCDFGHGGGASYGLHSVRGAEYQGIDYEDSDIQVDEWGQRAIYYWQTSTQLCM
jgi:hypothetical protein